MLRILPEWPATAAAEKPGRSVVLISAVASPSASTAGSHPEPSTSAMSCCSTPVSSARRVAASPAHLVVVHGVGIPRTLMPRQALTLDMSP